ncbi:MAG TPA: organomercurial lyase [Gemmatimonadaceae bacterium]|nr:organomercurial lyase [Gemmatimonadaceae bacterium]
MTVPTPQEIDAAVRLAIQEEFLLGRRPSVASVASTLGRDASDVDAAFDRLAAGRAVVLVQGTRDILMAAPFAGVQTDFRVRCGERSYYANCIWDAVGIPAMLAAAGRPSNASVETRCADCAAPLRLEVADGSLRAEPPDVVAHFAVPAAQWWADIVFT